ncbi:cytidine deaminase [Facklamia sp. 7083-14-GEN3]|uniref:cytidine deaminase n=1 Tax=Facklamia sp. 7083-14-GEN3 TaxID=2973478 RepID=UPI00215C94A5|nr:cytidine deaminase [Facklamia sp. 7083-14-GEN3]MCR8969062.1 cytidine deaminase [Facklamia sp. 7083-14-GEN3]
MKNIINELYKLAEERLNKEYPEGWGCMCAVYTNEDHIYFSKYFESISESAALCFETGTILEAFNNNEKITHSISLIRNENSKEINVVVPCGICQERLYTFGEGVNIIYRDEKTQNLKTITLKELNPYHWYDLYRDLE